MDDQIPPTPAYRSMLWRQTIVDWTLLIVGITQVLWLALALSATAWFIKSLAGMIFIATLAFVLVALFFPRLRLRWRLGAIMAFLGGNITTGLMYAGPNPGNTSLICLAVLFITLFWGLRAGLIALAALIGELALTGAGWRAGIFPPGGVGPDMDPRHLATWIRGAMAVANGAVAIALVISIVVRELSHAAKEASAALDREKQSETRYADLFERLPLGVYRTTADGRILAANPAFVAMLGFDRVEELTAINLESKEYFPDYNRAEFRARLEREGEIRGEETEWRRRDGSVIHWRENARAIRDASGKLLYYEGTVEDFTERKALEERLRQAQRLEAIGTLAGGVAHDLNNILTPMLMASELLEMKEPAADHELATLIKNGAKRGTDIIRKLFAFGRGSDGGGAAAVDPVHLLKEIGAIMRATFPRNIEIVEQYPPSLPLASADATQLYQVVMNLCVNARDAMSEGGRLTLGAGTAEPDGNLIFLSVEDTGNGIAPEIRERIFDPFFTTKEPGRGTGLGLWSAYSLVKAHGGYITVDSPPGRGATFKVFLRPAPSPAEMIRAGAEGARRGGSGQTILVVDDEPAILAATQRVLERAGYTVLTAAGGAEAERVAAEQRDAIRLVITDLMMPEMDGITLVSRLRRLLPPVKYIGVSGLDPNQRAESLAQAGFAEMLAKPYELAALTAAVNRALE
ncbi:MAG TPA: ATP-binding protein [Opitutaceae bacterium]|jgi:PAS domain S-box-containing protein|nr:ATP-binding protein [Opitutaceae bacterium]